MLLPLCSEWHNVLLKFTSFILTILDTCSKLELYNPLDIDIDTYCVDNTAEWLRSLVGTHAERLL